MRFYTVYNAYVVPRSFNKMPIKNNNLISQSVLKKRCFMKKIATLQNIDWKFARCKKYVYITSN